MYNKIMQTDAWHMTCEYHTSQKKKKKKEFINFLHFYKSYID